MKDAPDTIILIEVSDAGGRAIAHYGYDHRGLRNLKETGGQPLAVVDTPDGVPVAPETSENQTEFPLPLKHPRLGC